MKKWSLFLVLSAVLAVNAFGQYDSTHLDASIKELKKVMIHKLTLFDVPHTHHKGEWMFSVKYMNMGMQGLRENSESLSNDEALQDYMAVPENMTMQMFMAGVMYGLSDNITLMAMMPYQKNNMEVVTGSGGAFETASKNAGDLEFHVMGNIYHDFNRKFIGIIGSKFPTGSINERGTTPMSDGNEVRLPYPMQTGSGVMTPVAGLTYFYTGSKAGWGADLRGFFRFNDNENQYHPGNQYKLTTWYSYKMFNNIITTLRFENIKQQPYSGSDPELNPDMAPTADPDLQAGFNSRVGLGINFNAPDNFLKGGRITIEGKLPVYRHLQGPQLETDYIINAALIYVMH